MEHLRGALVPQDASDLAERYLTTKAARNDLVIAAHDLVDRLKSTGFVASLQYCRSMELEHPLPVITALSTTGKYLIPNINVVWDPTIPLEREGSGSASHRKRVIAGEDMELADPSIPPSSLRVERFAADHPVSIVLYPSDSTDAPALAVPIFSAAAFDEALRHAAIRVKDQSPLKAKYSYIFDELVIPQIRNIIKSKTALLGAREIPEVRDNGTTEDGRLFDVSACVPQLHTAETIRLQLALGVATGVAKILLVNFDAENTAMLTKE